MLKRLFMGLIVLGILGLIFGEAYAVPNQPSVVRVQGRQLIVQKRLPDGTLTAPQPYIIRGVTWSPATRAPDNGPQPPPYPGNTQYGFFWECWNSPPEPCNRVPPGHVVLNFWLKNEFAAHFQQDITLMQQMKVNTVRVYVDFGENPTIYNQILDYFYNNGIMVIMTVASSYDDLTDVVPVKDGMIYSARVIDLVNRYKNHPAILMWSLGNEWNFNRYYSNKSFAVLSSATNAAAAAIKVRDPNHPVSSCLGDQFGMGEPGSDIPTIVNACPNVDVWGINVYRGASFGNLFAQWQAVDVNKPFYLSEFGTDSFNTELSTGVPPCLLDNIGNNCPGAENRLNQSQHDIGLWSEIRNNLSAIDINKFCLGGLVFEFNDELWKVGNYHVDLGGLVDYIHGDTSYDEYTNEGFYMPGMHPDNVGNEEYFGIVDADRATKILFNDLKIFYISLGGVINTTPHIDSIGNKSVYVNNTLSFNVTARDADGDVITLDATAFPAGAYFPPASGVGQVTQTFIWRPQAAGTYTVTFRVTDSLGASTSQPIQIIVRLLKKAVEK